MERTPDSKPLSIRDREELSVEERMVLRAIRDTSYGAVEVVLHQSRIVQVVKTEKLRVESHPSAP